MSGAGDSTSRKNQKTRNAPKKNGPERSRNDNYDELRRQPILRHFESTLGTSPISERLVLRARQLFKPAVWISNVVGVRAKTPMIDMNSRRELELALRRKPKTVITKDATNGRPEYRTSTRKPNRDSRRSGIGQIAKTSAPVTATIPASGRRSRADCAGLADLDIALPKKELTCWETGKTEWATNKDGFNRTGKEAVDTMKNNLSTLLSHAICCDRCLRHALLEDLAEPPNRCAWTHEASLLRIWRS